MMVDFTLVAQYLLLFAGFCFGVSLTLVAQLAWETYGEYKQLFRDIAKAFRKEEK
jgi:hypothetical protein